MSETATKDELRINQPPASPSVELNGSGTHESEKADFSPDILRAKLQELEEAGVPTAGELLLQLEEVTQLLSNDNQEEAREKVAGMKALTARSGFLLSEISDQFAAMESTIGSPAESAEESDATADWDFGDGDAPEQEGDPSIGDEIVAASVDEDFVDANIEALRLQAENELSIKLQEIKGIGKKRGPVIAARIIDMGELGIDIKNASDLLSIPGVGPVTANAIAEKYSLTLIASVRPKHRRKHEEADAAELDGAVTEEATPAPAPEVTQEASADSGIRVEQKPTMLSRMRAAIARHFRWIGGKLSFKALPAVEDSSAQRIVAPETSAATILPEEPVVEATNPPEPEPEQVDTLEEATPETTQEVPAAVNELKALSIEELRGEIGQLTDQIDEQRMAGNELAAQRAEQRRNILRKELEQKAPKNTQEQPLDNQVDIANFRVEELPPGQQKAAQEIIKNPKISKERKHFLLGLLLIAAGVGTSMILRSLEHTTGPQNVMIAAVLRVSMMDSNVFWIDNKAQEMAASKLPLKDTLAKTLRATAGIISGSRDRINQFLLGFGGDSLLASFGIDSNELVGQAAENINQSVSSAITPDQSTTQQNPSLWSRFTGMFGTQNPPPLDMSTPSANPDLAAATPQITSNIPSGLDASAMPAPDRDVGLGFTGTEPTEPAQVSESPAAAEEINPYFPDRYLRANWPEQTPFDPNAEGIVTINRGVVWDALIEYFRNILPAESVTKATDVVKDVIRAINPGVNFNALQSPDFQTLTDPSQFGSQTDLPWMLSPEAIHKLADTVNNLSTQPLEPGSVKELLQQLSAGFPIEDLTENQTRQLLEFAYAK